MTIEELIYFCLIKVPEIQNWLAKYDKKPAVFLQRAPDDTAPEWGKKQYPRMEYLVDMSADPERHSSGVVTVHIYSDESGKPPEEIAPAVRNALCDILMKADRVYCITWAKTELFEIESVQSANTLVNGCTITFLLIAFPAQITGMPDPALAVNLFIKKCVPECYVIGMDDMDDIYEPSDEHPAIFVRIPSYEKDHESYALIWINCIIAIHVVALSTEGRMNWVRHLHDCFFRAGEVIMADNSPMFLKTIKVDNQSDYLTRGQIAMRGLYTMPALRPDTCGVGIPLNHAIINEETKNGRKRKSFFVCR